MNRTSLVVTKASNIDVSCVLVEGATADGLYARVPQLATVELRDHPLGTITAKVHWDQELQGMAVYEICIWNPNAGTRMAHRAIRGVHLADIERAVVEQAAGLARRTGPSWMDFEKVDGRPEGLYAERIAIGRTKAQRHREIEIIRATAIHEQVVAEGFKGDVYKEVAQRMRIARTTVYTYLREAGVVKPRSKGANR